MPVLSKQSPTTLRGSWMTDKKREPTHRERAPEPRTPQEEKIEKFERFEKRWIPTVGESEGETRSVPDDLDPPDPPMEEEG